MDVDVRRMQSFQVNRKYLEERTTETLGLLFDMHWRRASSRRRAAYAAVPSMTDWSPWAPG